MNIGPCYTMYKSNNLSIITSQHSFNSLAMSLSTLSLHKSAVHRTCHALTEQLQQFQAPLK
uniref:Uncharacterized protein n=1 Tax=Rhizophora mucronata TaxID=61149 RepID=A0A2P2N834_RHIMU